MRYGGFWIRFVADLIDTIVLWIAAGIVTLVLLRLGYFAASAWRASQGLEAMTYDQMFTAMFTQFFEVGIECLLGFPYYVWAHFKYGQTLGKRVLKLRVVQYGTHAPITFGQSVKRFFGYGVSGIIFMWGYIMAGWQPQKRALHDYIAGTVVVRL